MTNVKDMLDASKVTPVPTKLPESKVLSKKDPLAANKRFKFIFADNGKGEDTVFLISFLSSFCFSIARLI